MCIFGIFCHHNFEFWAGSASYFRFLKSTKIVQLDSKRKFWNPHSHECVCIYFLRDFERQYSCVDLFLSFFMIIFQIHFQIIYLWEILIKKYRIPKKKWDLSCDWCQIYISTSEIYQKYIQFYFRKAFVSKLLKDMVCNNDNRVENEQYIF